MRRYQGWLQHRTACVQPQLAPPHHLEPGAQEQGLLSLMKHCYSELLALARECNRASIAKWYGSLFNNSPHPHCHPPPFHSISCLPLSELAPYSTYLQAWGTNDVVKVFRYSASKKVLRTWCELPPYIASATTNLDRDAFLSSFCALCAVFFHQPASFRIGCDQIFSIFSLPVSWCHDRFPWLTKQGLA